MSDTKEHELEADIWSEWLLNGRHGRDPDYKPIMRAAVAQIRDRVLDGARLTSGMRLLDVGAGDGLISFEALRRVKPPFSVVLSDISTPLLKHAESVAAALGFHGQCSFVQTPAQTLAGIANESVDVITSRAVLAYVDDKPSALRSFSRVLKPGGRVSLADPIGQDAAVHLAALTKVLRSEPVNSSTPFVSLLQRWRALQTPSTLDEIRSNPLTNFSERDLVQLFRDADFVNIHMELHIDVKTAPPIPWSTFIEIPPRPGALCLREIFEQHFTAVEISVFERVMREDVEKGKLTSQNLNVYLTAEKRA
ncbi:class I SAM-dependent methyltransferase [Granulicella aggregans]|uniref:class I SAM-dependent methyltransferase n=1 Tax=Granulicella aggregans TaxID=474949 RepID=UPI0021DF8196|nr:class I SAM-dependent methyltransferase [Granulicella aggregans]